MREIKRGQVWLVELGQGQGSEQGGTRPALILQNDVGNRYSPTTIVAVITSKGNRKHQIPTHYDLDNDFFLLPSTVLLEQVRTIDKTRLKNLYGTLTRNQMAEIEKKLKISLGMA
jgi:mRNA interferase MazF